jgi:uncharacterized protein YndB with AHSA1/START domain
MGNTEGNNNNVSELKEREMIFTRVLNAPRELVFDAWVIPEHLAQWYGPNGFTITTNTIDVKPGGRWDFIMHGPDGDDYPNKIKFLEVRKPEKLVYTHTGDGVTDDVKFRVTVSFENVEGKTKLTMHSVFDTAEELEKVVKNYGAYEAAIQHLARLEAFLSKQN